MGRPIDSRDKLPTVDDASPDGKVYVWLNNRWTRMNYDAVVHMADKLSEGLYWKKVVKKQREPRHEFV